MVYLSICLHHLWLLHQISSHTGMPCWDIVHCSKRCHCPASPSHHQSLHVHSTASAQSIHNHLYNLLTLPSPPPPSTKAVILPPSVSLFCAFFCFIDMLKLFCWPTGLPQYSHLGIVVKIGALWGDDSVKLLFCHLADIIYTSFKMFWLSTFRVVKI